MVIADLVKSMLLEKTSGQSVDICLAMFRFYLNNILELDQETGNWSNVAYLESSRSNHGVSATDLTDLWKYCV